MSSISDDIGYSVRRNGSCESTEQECGGTWSEWHACCPKGTKCPRGRENVICCDSDADCLNYFKDSPRCANSTANLYYADNYFCCPPDLKAFERPDGLVGCAEDEKVLGSTMTLLNVNSTGSTMMSSTSFPSATSSSTFSSVASVSAQATSSSTDSAKSDSDGGSGTNTGAIAGGVVGGVAAVSILAVLFWFARKRGNKKRFGNGSDTSNYFTAFHSRGQSPSELPAEAMSELPSNASNYH